MTAWPDAVVKLAKAISVAEGSPPEWNNPGSLKIGDVGSFQTSGLGNKEGVVKFVSAADGWTALYVKLSRILSGRSLTYPLVMTLREMGMKYSGGDPNWSSNVAKQLGVSEDITIEELNQTLSG